MNKKRELITIKAQKDKYSYIYQNKKKTLCKIDQLFQNKETTKYVVGTTIKNQDLNPNYALKSNV